MFHVRILFFARDGVCMFLAENLREAILNFFAKKVARGNAVQIFKNFPAKSLSIYREDFFFTPFY